MSEQSNETLSEQTALLREIVKWLRFTGMKEVKSVLGAALDNDQKKLVYHLSDGNNGCVEIAQQSGVSDFTVRNYWKQWSKLGIVEAIKVRRGDRYKKSFDLEDFGMEIPQRTQPNSTEPEGEER
jgi:Fic family protein